MFGRFFSFVIVSISCVLFSSFSLPPELLHQYVIRMQSGFGKSKSDVEVYIFSDWQNSSSAKNEPLIADIATQSVDKSSVYFVDKISPETIAINRANIALLLDNKKELKSYLQAREAFFKLAATNPNLTGSDICTSLKALHIECSEVSDLNFETGRELFLSIFKNLQITNTPAVVVFNVRDSRKQKFDDFTTLSAGQVVQAISSLSAPEPEVNKKTNAS